MPKRKREIKHPEYYAIKAYQILEKISDEEMATLLGMTKRTYCDKVKGYADFTPAEGIAIAKFLHKTQDEIFLT